MTTEIIAHMLTDDRERCKLCNDPISGEPFHVDDYGEPFCSKDCVESYEDNQAEAAYESFCSDFYGGSSPVTLDEQHAAARKVKYGY